MVDSQEIIERSVYKSILDTAVKLGYCIDPNDYLPVNAENTQRFNEDKSKLKKYIWIFGSSNNLATDQKTTPRIVVNPKGFYPGAIGLPKELLVQRDDRNFHSMEAPYETIDQYIDIHLVANNVEDIRLLHQILFWAIPQRGYIKPYTEARFMFSGNIFIELVNFYDNPNLQFGLLEKVYEFEIQDCLIGVKDPDMEAVPIVDISAFLDNPDDAKFKLNVKSKNS